MTEDEKLKKFTEKVKNEYVGNTFLGRWVGGSVESGLANPRVRGSNPIIPGIVLNNIFN